MHVQRSFDNTPYQYMCIHRLITYYKWLFNVVEDESKKEEVGRKKKRHYSGSPPPPP